MAVFAVFAKSWVRAEPVITAVITVGRANGSSSAGYTVHCQNRARARNQSFLAGFETTLNDKSSSTPKPFILATVSFVKLMN